MPNKPLFLALILSLSSLPQHAFAQGGNIGPFPLGTCSLVSNIRCPRTSGCCSAGGCCGSGCCGLLGVCINAGTSSATCCDIGDPTRCGTLSTTTNPPVSYLYTVSTKNPGSYFPCSLFTFLLQERHLGRTLILRLESGSGIYSMLRRRPDKLLR